MITTTINSLLTNRPSVTIDPKADAYDWGLVNDHKDIDRMLTAAKRFSTGILLDESPRWLTLLGRSGSGKTHLAKKILEFWRARGRWKHVNGIIGNLTTIGDSRFVSWLKYLNRLRDGQRGEIISISETPFVVIDDIGTESGSDFANEKLYDLLDSRCRKWTVITSNLGMEHLQKIDTRITSRMIRGESVVVETQVEDWNLRRRKV
jgi:DNA replication protein DnaC